MKRIDLGIVCFIAVFEYQLCNGLMII